MTSTNISEKQIENDILTYLAGLDSVFCWKNNTTGIWDSRKQTYRTPAVFQINGVSDILGFTKSGRMIALEVKNKSGRLSPTQRKFLEKATAWGVIAGVVRSIEDVKRLLQREGLLDCSVPAEARVQEVCPRTSDIELR